MVEFPICSWLMRPYRSFCKNVCVTVQSICDRWCNVCEGVQDNLADRHLTGTSHQSSKGNNMQVTTSPVYASRSGTGEAKPRMGGFMIEPAQSIQVAPMPAWKGNNRVTHICQVGTLHWRLPPLPRERLQIQGSLVPCQHGAPITSKEQRIFSGRTRIGTYQSPAQYF